MPNDIKDDGGPAFPFEFTQTYAHGPPDRLVHTGMTLRDYFAAQALPAFVAAYSQTGLSFPHIAQLSYDLADHMLKVRQP
jgi:hypothetical protein